MRKIDLSNFQVARSETARNINRRVMLNLIRQNQPISRADLARHSGLQRSTVSIITEQLIKERWVTEGAIGQAPRGRKPRFLHLNKERVGIIGVNIRPAITTFGVANLDAQFLVQESMPTAANPNEFMHELSKRINHLVSTHSEISFEGIGVSLPGRVNLTTQQLVFAPNLEWGAVDLKKELETAVGLPVELENAANACALAEMWFGKHPEGVRNLIAITVSEGIGAGIVVNGQLVRGSTGAAGEFGHVTIVRDGLPCRCGNQGCWEMYASNAAAVRYYTQATTRTRNGKGVGQTIESAITIEDILRLAEQDAPKAVQALELMASYIGIGLANLVTGLAPDAIVIIGEVTRAWQKVGPIIAKVIKERCFTHAAPVIHATDPASQPRLRGTIALVLQEHFGAPVVA